MIFFNKLDFLKMIIQKTTETGNEKDNLIDVILK